MIGRLRGRLWLNVVGRERSTRWSIASISVGIVTVDCPSLTRHSSGLSNTNLRHAKVHRQSRTQGQVACLA